MSKKTTITAKQAHQFNQMRATLIKIHKGYMTPEQIRKSDDAEFHGFSDALSMAYENIQEEARISVKGIKSIPVDVPVTATP